MVKHCIKLGKLIKEFISLNPVEQREFILKTSSNVLSLIVEIIYNYLKGKIDNFEQIKTKLKKFKNFIREIVKKKYSHKYIREHLSTVRGLHILRLIFPLALKYIENGV